MKKTIYSYNDIKALLKCGNNKAYSVIKTLNKELEDKGSLTLQGKVPAEYFHERYKGYSRLEE